MHDHPCRSAPLRKRIAYRFEDKAGLDPTQFGRCRIPHDSGSDEHSNHFNRAWLTFPSVGAALLLYRDVRCRVPRKVYVGGRGSGISQARSRNSKARRRSSSVKGRNSSHRTYLTTAVQPRADSVYYKESFNDQKSKVCHIEPRKRVTAMSLFMNFLKIKKKTGYMDGWTR